VKSEIQNKSFAASELQAIRRMVFLRFQHTIYNNFKFILFSKKYLFFSGKTIKKVFSDKKETDQQTVIYKARGLHPRRPLISLLPITSNLFSWFVCITNTSQPKFNSSRTKSLSCQPNSLSRQPNLISSQPKPISSQPKPISSQAKPISCQPEPVSHQPKHVSYHAKPISWQTNGISSQEKVTGCREKPGVLQDTKQAFRRVLL
jgi:hypothetical protein